MSNNLNDQSKNEFKGLRSSVSKAKSFDCLFSISSINSFSRSYDSLIDIVSEQKEIISSKFEVKKEIKSAWIPICDQKRRVRDQIVGDALSKSPQVNDVLRLINSVRMSPLGRSFGSDSNLNYYADSK
jgi:hypothetical protein